MASRPHSRLRRALLTALVTASVAVPVSGAARPTAVPAPAPTALGPLRTVAPAALAERYATTRSDIRAAGQTALAHGDLGRARSLRAMARPGRHFLSFDGRDGGRTAEVFGDLSRARRIAVLVPGSDTGIDQYKRLLDGATALQRQLGGGAAVVAWLGYATPATVSTDVLTTGRADRAAPVLRRFVRELGGAAPAARISLLCHSYGSVVCGRAAPGLAAADLVLYGSPGAGRGSAAALHTRATVWAGRGRGDWIADVPHVRIPLPFVTLGLGADPVAAGFGARVFDAGGGGHSDYLKPGSLSLANLARIVSGQPPAGEARHA
ncbi:alpha/beta hydrolase [Streptomyces sp. NPDC059398]|uniref:alpha/beta hydrolase n=1 Tax=Streptomyces sp. NPDC059398 TaxID=3346820 RepID=UPI00368E95C1